MGLPYPGGPHVDRLARQGDPKAFFLAHPLRGDKNFSFSGLKTSFLYLLRDETAKDADFVEKRRADLCATLQATIIEILLSKLRKHIEETGILRVAIGGGVAANEGLRGALKALGVEMGLEVFLPARRFTTDNAAMIAIAGYFKCQVGEFASQDVTASPRLPV